MEDILTRCNNAIYESYKLLEQDKHLKSIPSLFDKRYQSYIDDLLSKPSIYRDKHYLADEEKLKNDRIY